MFQSHFLVGLWLLVFIIRGVDVGVFWAFQTSLSILWPFLQGLINGCILRSLWKQAIFSLILVHNSIEWTDIIIGPNYHWLYHVELEVRLCHVGSSSIVLGSFRSRRQRSLQVELPRVLILGRWWMMYSYYCTLVKSECIISFVA